MALLTGEFDEDTELLQPAREVVGGLIAAGGQLDSRNLGPW
jgi:hypothetical protein